MKEEQYLLVVNASNIEKIDWISAQNDLGVDMKTFLNTILISNSGPKAVEAMQHIFNRFAAINITILKWLILLV
jgi:glycine cleavage system aminomethyltransferase T